MTYLDLYQGSFWGFFEKKKNIPFHHCAKYNLEARNNSKESFKIALSIGLSSCNSQFLCFRHKTIWQCKKFLLLSRGLERINYLMVSIKVKVLCVIVDHTCNPWYRGGWGWCIAWVLVKHTISKMKKNKEASKFKKATNK